MRILKFQKQTMRYNKLKSMNKILGYILGSILVISGLAKLISIDSFADVVAQYNDTYLCFPYLTHYRHYIAVIVCFVELLTGIAFFLDSIKNIAAVVAVLMFLFFTYLTGHDYLFPTSEGGVYSCGCFGDLMQMSPKSSFLKSLLLSVMSLINLALVCIVEKQTYI